MDPINNIPQTPGSLSGMSEASGMKPELSQDEMRSKMQEAMSKIDESYGDFEANRFSLENREKEMNGRFLREIFEFFESVGIDPSNSEDVKTYLEDISVKDPELYKQVESLLNMALKEQGQETENNMNINTPDETVQENV